MIDTRRQVLERPGVAMAERQSTNSAMLAQAETAVIEVASRGRVQDVIDADRALLPCEAGVARVTA